MDLDAFLQETRVAIEAHLEMHWRQAQGRGSYWINTQTPSETMPSRHDEMQTFLLLKILEKLEAIQNDLQERK